MNLIRPRNVHDIANGSPGVADNIDLRQFFLMFWRRKWMILAIVVVVTAIAYFLIDRLTPIYSAEAVVQLRQREIQALPGDPMFQGMKQDELFIRSEVDVLRSRSLARRVVQDLSLIEDPEFNRYLRPEEPGLLPVVPVPGWLPEWLHGAWTTVFGEEAQSARDVSPARVMSSVISAVQRNLTVLNDGKSYSMEIQFASEDPQKAAKIANSFVDMYLTNQYEAKYEATERTTQWIENKLSDLQDRLRKAGSSVADFKEKNSIVSLGTEGASTLALNQLAELSGRLIAARADRASVEAQLRELKPLMDSPDRAMAAPRISGSPQIQALRAQESTVANKLDQLRGSYGEKHPFVRSAKEELAELRQRISQEVRRVYAGLQTEVQVARQREAELERRVDQLRERNEEANRAAVSLSYLESQATAAKSLYDTFLAGLDKTVSQIDNLQADAQVLSPAEPPLWPSFPQTNVLMGLAFGASLMLGLALALLLEFLDKGFRNAEQLERQFGAPVLGMVPLVRYRSTGKRHPSSFALANPFSAYAETVRSIYTALRFSQIDRPPRILLVTSAISGEGKTAMALTLGRLIAMSGKKVTLIDCDLRKPTAAQDLEFPLGDGIEGEGLTAYLSGRAPLQEIIRIDEQSGLRIVPARGKSPFSAEVLSSKPMRELVDSMAKENDLVILDSPPVSIVSDATALAKIADVTLMVVRWGHTPRNLVSAAFKRFTAANVSVTGVALTQVDMVRYPRYGYGDDPSAYAKGYYAT